MPNPLSISQLRGAPLSILLVMSLPQFRGTNVTVDVLIMETGYKSPKIIKDGLALLHHHGYVHCIGQLGQGGADLWALAADCPSFLPAPAEQIVAPTTPAPVAVHDEPPGVVEDELSASTPSAANAIKNFFIASSSSSGLSFKGLSSSDLKLPPPQTPTLQKKYIALPETALPEAPPVSPPPITDAQRLAELLTAECSTRPKRALAAVERALAKGKTPAQVERYILEWSEHLEINPSRAPWGLAACNVEDCMLPKGLKLANNWELTPRQRRILELRGEVPVGDYYNQVMDDQAEQSPPVPEPEAIAPVAPTEPPLPPPASPLWEKALAQLALEMPKHTFETWVRGTWLAAQTDTQITIGVPSTYAQDWLQNRLNGAIKRTLSGLLGHEVAIKFEVNPGA